MKTPSSGLVGLLLVLTFSLAFILYFFSDILLNPNGYLFGFNSDAIKNYFTYAAHIEDDALINSSFINYPYGENFLYLDCHPLFTMIMKVLAIPFPGITLYSIGILNFLMIAAYVIASVFIYLILRKLKVNIWFAAANAVAIALLSPQIFRIYGHFALSYSFMIPLTWYLFIRFTETTNHLKWSVYIAINNLLWYLIHGYMGMMAVSFIFISHLSYLIIYKQKLMLNWRSWLNLALQTVVPLLLFWMLMLLSDWHSGRNKAPTGIMELIANFHSVFLPHRQPLKIFFDRYIEYQANWEGWSYIGIASSFMIIVFALNTFLKLFRIRVINDKPFLHNPAMVTALISAVLLLFLSMGYPFKLNMENLLEHVKVINNFRSIGRFAWIFYYVITVWAVYYTYLFFESRKRVKYLWIPVILIIPLAYYAEAIPYHTESTVRLREMPNYFSLKHVPDELLAGLNSFDEAEYQAIIPLPYFLIGSEQYKKSVSKEAYLIFMTLSYHSKLPLLANYSANSSIFESRKLYQLLAPVTYKKEIESDIESDKPFLVVYSKEDLDAEERSILNRSQLIYENDKFSILSLRKDNLFIDSSGNYISSFSKIKDQLVDRDGFLVRKSDKDKYFKYYSYDSLEGEIKHTGPASYHGDLKNYNLLAKTKPFDLIEGQTYIFSFWMHNDLEQLKQKTLEAFAILESKNSKGDAAWLVNANPFKSVNIDGQWTLIELEYTITDSSFEYSVLLKGKEDNSSFDIYIDDLLIREKGMEVYKVLGTNDAGVNKLFYNNHFIELR